MVSIAHVLQCNCQPIRTSNSIQQILPGDCHHSCEPQKLVVTILVPVYQRLLLQLFLLILHPYIHLPRNTTLHLNPTIEPVFHCFDPLQCYVRTHRRDSLYKHRASNTMLMQHHATPA